MSPELNQVHVRAHVQQFRKTIGWSQYDLSRASNVGRTRLSLFENGHIELRADELKALLHALREAASRRVTEVQGVLAEDMADITL
jgi:predicted transcriptional regulator